MITAAALVSGCRDSPGVGAGAAVSVSALLIVGACVAWGIDNSATSRIDQIAPQHVTFLKGAVAGTVNLLLASSSLD